MKKRILSFLLPLLLIAVPVLAQQVGQYNPVNTLVIVGTTATATYTIASVTGQRVRLYHVIWKCNTPGTSTIPTLTIMDAGNTVFSIQNRTVTAGEPIGEFSFSPDWTFSSGGAVVISANVGAACGGGTTLLVQADQF